MASEPDIGFSYPSDFYVDCLAYFRYVERGREVFRKCAGEAETLTQLHECMVRNCGTWSLGLECYEKREAVREALVEAYRELGLKPDEADSLAEEIMKFLFNEGGGG